MFLVLQADKDTGKTTIIMMMLYITYWKITVFIPTLDHVTTDMRERFAEENIYHLKFNILLPSQLLKHDGNDLAYKLNQCLTELPFFEEESPL